MLCLSDSIRHDDPAVPPLLRTIDKAQTLAQQLIAAWPLARVLALHIVAHVLAEPGPTACRLAPVSVLWERMTQSGLCPTSAHESVWAAPLETTRRTVSARV